MSYSGFVEKIQIFCEKQPFLAKIELHGRVWKFLVNHMGKETESRNLS